MKIFDTGLPEVKRIALDAYPDNRGFFVEQFRADKLAQLGITEKFVQTNWSRSLPRVIRGLHFQHAPMQGKLVGVTRGAVIDVAVDVRPASPNFGKHVAVELSDDNRNLLWIPAGFAHGFAVLGDAAADVVYHVTAHYSKEGENGIRLNDVDIAIDWPTPIEDAILSPRDLAQPSLAEAKTNLETWFKQ